MRRFEEYEDNGGYYNTAEITAAHPVPYGPTTPPEWYWTTTASSKSNVSKSPMLNTRGRLRR